MRVLLANAKFEAGNVYHRTAVDVLVLIDDARQPRSEDPLPIVRVKCNARSRRIADWLGLEVALFSVEQKAVVATGTLNIDGEVCFRNTKPGAYELRPWSVEQNTSVPPEVNS
ncbi:MAG: hypothetical protein V4519_02425 [Patescibacteria group bacterium]